MNVSKEKTKEDVSDHYEKNCNLEAVYDIGGLDMPVQLMLMSEPTFKCVVPQFPLSLCQAWYKNGKVSVGKDFLISLRHKVLYKTNQVYGDDSRYIKKICKRFSDYRYFPSKEACLGWVVLNSGEKQCLRTTSQETISNQNSQTRISRRDMIVLSGLAFVVNAGRS